MKNGFSKTIIGAVAALLAVVGLVPLGAPASGTSSFSFTRFGGADRFDTARLIAQASFGNAPTVLLARGDLFPDALAGAYLAGSTGGGAPVLLTRTDSLPAATNDAMTALGTTKAILLGGTNAIGVAVENQLRARNIQVDRVSGATRFDTAQAVAERPGPSNVGTVDNLATAIVASGRNFPDALAGGPLSYASRLPTLLTEVGFLSQQARNGLSNLAIKQVYLLGGPVAVSQAVEDQIKAMGIVVTRLQGGNRQATAIAIADLAIAKLGFSNSHVNLARGDDFADALSLAPHAGKEKAPILLTGSPTVLDPTTKKFFTDHASTLSSGNIAGGPNAVSQAVADEATAAAKTARASVTVTTQSASAGGNVVGKITGEGIKNVTVSGCGLTNQPVTRDAQGNFSVVIPANQPAGECELTFTTTFDDNTTQTDKSKLTITAAPASLTSTRGPELSRVQFQSAQINANGTPQPTTDDFSQATIRFVFDEPVTGQIPVPAGFHLVTFDNGRYDAVFATVDTNDTRVVQATFGTQANPVSADAYSFVTTATVDTSVVKDIAGDINPEGDAPVNQVVINRVAGQTAAPDAIAAQGFRAGQPAGAIGQTLVDVTFDEPAFVVNPAGFHLLLVDGTSDITCTGPNRGSTAVGGGTTTGGNGTSTITVSCPITANDNQQITAGRASRMILDTDTVSDARNSPDPIVPGPDAVEGAGNPLQVAEVEETGGISGTPDLVSAAVDQNAVIDSIARDTIRYVFDQPVTTTTGANTLFFWYDRNGDEFNCTVGPPRRSTTDDRVVDVICPDGSLGNTVGASVDDGAVTAATGNPNPNQEDEVGVTNNSSTFAAGRTSAPDLTETGIAEAKNEFGTVIGSIVTWVFDQDVDPTTGANNIANLSLYLADTTRLDCTASFNPTDEANDHKVTCGSFVIGYVPPDSSAGAVGSAATQTQIQNAVLGAVDDGAVVAEGAALQGGAGANPGGPVNPRSTNPEGSERTSGGKGTPV